MLDLVAIAYRAPMETSRFFDSFVHMDVPFTLTVVENSSPEPDVRRVIEEKAPEVERNKNCLAVEVVYNQSNVGYARACNFGAMKFSNPYIGLLNCDLEWRPRVASRIIQRFESDERIGVVGPRTTDSDGRLTHSGIVKRGSADGHRYWLQQDRGQASDVIDAQTVSGSTYFIRRDVWDFLTDCPQYRVIAPRARGAFLPTEHYFEETFCSYHATAHGWRVVYDGTVHMIHEWGRSDSGAIQKFWDRSKRQYVQACAAHGISYHGA